jgi:hypothetical protein
MKNLLFLQILVHLHKPKQWFQREMPHIPQTGPKLVIQPTFLTLSEGNPLNLS